jgi:hypothetical protein
MDMLLNLHVMIEIENSPPIRQKQAKFIAVGELLFKHGVCTWRATGALSTGHSIKRRMIKEW